MKTNIHFLIAAFVFSMMVTPASFAASPSASWVDSGLTSTISIATMDPDTSISGGGINSFATGDFDCDGHDDLAVSTGASRYGKVYIHLGGTTGTFSTSLTSADYIITGTVSRQYLGINLIKINDVDGDNCPELVLVGDNRVGSGKDGFYLYGSSTIAGWATDSIADSSYTDSDADSKIETSASASNNYLFIHSVGNINGVSDGEYLAVCSQSTFICYLMPVSALVAGTGTVESESLYYIKGELSNLTVVGADINGDGIGDLIVGSPTNSTVINVSAIYGPISTSSPLTFASGYFHTSDLAKDENISIVNTGSINSLGTIVSAVDIDNDGKDEIVVSYPGAASTTGYYFLVSGLDNLKGVTNTMYADYSTGSYNFSSSEIQVASYHGEAGAYLGYENNYTSGDFNGDGYNDVLFGGNNYIGSTGKGRGYILYNHTVSEDMPGAHETFEDDFGKDQELSASNRADAYIDGASTSDQFTKKVLAADFDGDGKDEIVAYAPGPNSGYGQLAIITLPDDVDGDGVAAKDGDCDDSNPDTDLPNTWYADADGDSKGDIASTTTACAQPDGYVSDNTDCDDTDASVTKITWYWDADSDGYGGTTFKDTSCSPMDSHGSGGWVTNADDCDDSDASINPDTIWYLDSDGDGYGDVASTTVSCVNPSVTGSTYVLNSSDCNDADASFSPDTVWYQDADEDTYGNVGSSTTACEQPDGYVADNTDCDDSLASLNPTTVWYLDSDHDGYGDAASTTMSCEAPIGYVSDPTDPDDTSSAVYVGASENCIDGLDNDGNGLIDSADPVCITGTDADGDGYTASDGDCDDTSFDVKPGAAELGDAVDNDCDGRTDEGLLEIKLTSTFPGSVSVGDKFFVTATITNKTGMNNFELVVLIPDDPAILTYGSGFTATSCGDSLASGCTTIGTKTFTVDSILDSPTTGGTKSVSATASIPAGTADGRYPVRLWVLNTDTGEVQAKYKVMSFPSALSAKSILVE